MKKETRNTHPQIVRNWPANEPPQLEDAGAVIEWTIAEIEAPEEATTLEITEAEILHYHTNKGAEIARISAVAVAKFAGGVLLFSWGVVVFSARNLGTFLAWVGRGLIRGEQGGKSHRMPYKQPDKRKLHRRGERGGKTQINIFHIHDCESVEINQTNDL